MPAPTMPAPTMPAPTPEPPVVTTPPTSGGGTPPPPTGQFDPLAYGNWLSASLGVPGRHRAGADSFEFHIPGSCSGRGRIAHDGAGGGDVTGTVSGRNTIDNTASSGGFRMEFDASQGFSVYFSGGTPLVDMEHGSIAWAPVPNLRRGADHTWTLSATISTQHGGQGLRGYIYDGNTVAGSVSHVDAGVNWQGYWAGRK